jgi:excisionase family DNA binding protein
VKRFLCEAVVAREEPKALFVGMSAMGIGRREHEDGSEYEGGVLLLTMTEAARVLSIGRTTMYELVGAGEIDVVHIGRSARVPVGALAEFVERRRADGATVRPSRRAARAGQEPGPGQPTT